MTRHLQIDEATQKDLEIFASEQTSLFEFCNRTRTFGGARVLKKRMSEPFSNATDIDKVQSSLKFILANRELFKRLPSAFMADRVDQYTHDILPVVTHRSRLEFTAAAFSLWMNHDRHYTAIAVGVQMTCGFLSQLKKFVGLSELGGAPGELNEILHRIVALLQHDDLEKVPETQIGGWPLRNIRLDQIFRVLEKTTIVELQTLLHEVDAMVAMADVCKEHNYSFPEILSGDVRFEAEGLVHPFVEGAVSNPAQMDQARRVQFLTGPNMAGKTTYLRAVGISLYFAHLGMGVPAKRYSFVPVNSLFTSISLSDDLRGGVSYFRAEALRVKAIAEALASGSKVIALMDEPFKGTNVKDALDASRAMLDRFALKQDCLFLVASHLIELSEQFAHQDRMDCQYFEADEREGKLRFDYQLRPGVSAQRLGMRVLEEEGVFDLLNQ